MSRIVFRILTTCYILVAPACISIVPEPEKPFHWLQEGYTTYYNAITSTDTILNTTSLQWSEDYLDVNTTSGNKDYFDLNFLENKIKYNSQGVLFHYTEYCSLTWTPFNGAHYLRIPVSVNKGDTILDTLCEERVMRSLTVSAVDSSLSVPMGDFSCFVFEHSNRDDKRRDREYWSNTVGLVQYEVRDSLNNLIKTYQLSQVLWP